MPAAPVRTIQAAALRRLSQGRLLARAAHARGACACATAAFQAGGRSRSRLRAGARRPGVGAHLQRDLRLPERGRSLHASWPKRCALADRAIARRLERGRGVACPGRRAVDRVLPRGLGAGGRAARAEAQAQLAPRSRMAYAWALFRAGASRLGASRRHAARWRAIRSRRASDMLVALAIGARRYDLALREVRPTGPGGPVDPVVGHAARRTRSCLPGRRRAAPSAISGRGSRCARCACTRSAGRPRPRRSPIRSAASWTPEHYALPAPVRRPRRLPRLARRRRAVDPLARAGRRPLADAAPLAARVRACSTRCANRPEFRGRLRAGASRGRGAAPRAPRGDRRLTDAAAAEFRCDVPTAELPGGARRRRRCRSAWSSGDTRRQLRTATSTSTPATTRSRRAASPAGSATAPTTGAPSRWASPRPGCPVSGPAELFEADAGAVDLAGDPGGRHRPGAPAPRRWWISRGWSRGSSWRSIASPASPPGRGTSRAGSRSSTTA